MPKVPSQQTQSSLYQCLGRKEDANNIESTHPVPSFFIYHNNHTIYIYIYWSVCGCYYGRWTAEGEWERGRDFCNEIILLPCGLLKKRNEKWGKKGELKDIDELVMMAGAYCMIQDGVQNLNYLAKVFHSFWIVYSLKPQLLH